MKQALEYINFNCLFETSKIILKLVVVDTDENTFYSNDEIIYLVGPYSEIESI